MMNSSKKRVLNSWMNVNTWFNHFFHTSPFGADFDTPRVLIVAEDLRLVFALPYHVSGNTLRITGFDFWLQERYEWKTVFPIAFSQINDGIYYSKNLFICGIHGPNFFLCRFNFVDFQWTVIIDDSSKGHPRLNVFIPKTNGIRGFFNYSDGSLTILHVDQEHRLVYNQSANNPPSFTGGLKAYDGDERIFVIGLNVNNTNKVAIFHTSTLTWEILKFQDIQELVSSESSGYCSVFYRENSITLFVPEKDGTKVWQMNLNNLSTGWLQIEQLPEIVVWTKFSFQTQELYGLIVKKSGYGCSLSMLCWAFTVPSLEEICLENITRSIQTIVNKRSGEITAERAFSDVLKNACLSETFASFLSARFSFTTTTRVLNDNSDGEHIDDGEMGYDSSDDTTMWAFML